MSGELRLRRSDADVFVPDGLDLDAALARTTDLGVGAHPDDLEFGYLVPIGECRGLADRWFVGVTCTDGAGSARGGGFAAHTDAEMVVVRREEQRRAAVVGEYGAVFQLGHPSADVKSDAGSRSLADELASILHKARPLNLYTHNPADKHDTHQAVMAATVHAVRELAPTHRPARFVGIEGWRDLDWLGDGEKLRLDATPYIDLAARFAAVYESQIEGAKRYDVAIQGRRRANATLHGIRVADEAEEVIVAIDLTPLLRNDDLDPVDYTLSAIERFRDDVEGSLRRWFH
jgi:LmbE family N-acetylglucosaminyl deacetylase